MTINDPRDEKLDRLLRMRRVEAVSGDLAQRIILRARETQQNPSLSLWQSVRELCLEFHLPKPAYIWEPACGTGLMAKPLEESAIRCSPPTSRLA